MATTPQCDRRAIFNASALKAAASHFLPAPARTAELTVARRAMACEFSIILPASGTPMVDTACTALDELDRLEALLSVYKEYSEISRINQTAANAPVPVDAEVYHLLRAAIRLSAATAGAFDPTAGALVKAWGFFRGPKRVPTELERAAALAATGHHYVLFDDDCRTISLRRPGVQFNLGAIGKGYAIDRALHRLRAGLGPRPCALMQGGQSSLRAMGVPPGQSRGWTVALGDPCRPQRSIARIHLLNQALGTSGAANQYFVHDGRRFGHILDPRTGWPAHRLLSASAVAPTSAEADALSTAFFVLGVEGTRAFLRDRPEYGAVLIYPKQTQTAALEVLSLGAAHAEVMQ